MIDIGNLLDACGIYYTDKQLSKLDKLVNELLKKLCLQQFDFNETAKHDSIPYSENKSRIKDLGNKTELKSSQGCIQEFCFED